MGVSYQFRCRRAYRSDCHLLHGCERRFGSKKVDESEKRIDVSIGRRQSRPFSLEKQKKTTGKPVVFFVKLRFSQPDGRRECCQCSILLRTPYGPSNR